MKVFLGIPTSDLKVNPDLIASVMQCSPSGKLHGFRTHSYSCLPRNFNELFCAALNARKDGATHFCMLHSDVVPHGIGWLDVMCDEMERVGADVLSAVIPLKISNGMTSTAMDEPVDGSDAYWRPRRLSMTEVYNDYPETFTSGLLLVNTGLMLVDMRKDWVNNIWFQFEDRISRDAVGNFVALNVPEDWDFSRRAKKLGAKIYATRKVAATHFGHMGFGNMFAFGKKTDSLK